MTINPYFMELKSNINRKFSTRELTELSEKTKKGKHKNFHTYDYLGSNLAQIYFIHNEQIFNCSIISLKGDYMQEVSDLVHDKIKELYPKYFDFDFIPCEDKPGFSEMVRKDNYDEKEVMAYEEELYKSICESKEVRVRERIEVDFSFEYGIGITVYVDKDKITLPICNKVIKMIKSFDVLYEGKYYLGESMCYTYKESKKHKLIGAGLCVEGNEDLIANLDLNDMEELNEDLQ